MGAYLSCGIAKSIAIDKKQRFCGKYEKEEILEEIKKEIDLNIYDIKETENAIYLELKPKIFEENAVAFVKEQLEKRNLNKDYVKEDLEKIKKLEGKDYEELIEAAKEKSCRPFQLIEGCILTNDISYISDSKFEIHADIIIYIMDGKAIMECYSDLFYYLRKTIMNESNNPIKSSVVLTLD